MKRKWLRFIGYLLITGLIASLSLCIVACRSSTEIEPVPVGRVSSIVVTRVSTTNLAVGSHTQFTATATIRWDQLVNNSLFESDNISSQANWTSSDPTVAVVFSTGLATGLAAGTTNITASLSGVTSPAITLTVINP